MGAIRSACPFAAVIAAALASVTAGPAAAADDHDSCVGFIDELPVVISTQGTWCMRGNLTFMVDVADIAVQVQVPGVTIDCQGSRLVGKPTSYGLPRWAIVSYIRALQLSQRATVNDVPADRRGDLDRPAEPQAAPAQENRQQ